jgi:hypothetical protein
MTERIAHLARKTFFISPLALAAGLTLLPGVARADSDGYFCTAKGYVAVEFRPFSYLEPSSKHVLRIVRFGMVRGIYWGGEISLPDFQTHYMNCQPTRVEIAGWKGAMRFTVDLTQLGSPRLVDTGENPGKDIGNAPEPANLGRWSRPGNFLLDSDDPRHTYQLVCTVSDKPVEQTIEHHHKTEIVQRDRDGKVSQKMLVFEGTEVETID